MADDEKPYCVAFDTKEAAPRIKATAVKLSVFYMKNVDSVRVDLADHPLYPDLHKYCMANPPGGRKK